MTLRTVSHAELNAEINAQSDEQHKERNRNQIERANHCETERRSDRKSTRQAENARENQLPGTQRQPQDEQYAQQRKGRVSKRALSDHRELIIVHRNRAGKRNVCTVPVAELQIRGRSPDAFRRRVAGLQRGKVQTRLHLNEATK